MTDFLDSLPGIPALFGVPTVLLWLTGFHRSAVGVLVIGAIVYVYACVAFPWARCPPQLFVWGGCGGAGEQKSPFSDHYRPCRKCGKTRRVVRLGRRVWTFATDIDEDRK